MKCTEGAVELAEGRTILSAISEKSVITYSAAEKCEGDLSEVTRVLKEAEETIS